MKLVNKIIGHPMWSDWSLFRYLVILHIAKYLPDKLFLRIVFPLQVGYKLNLDNPMSYNEKLQWLKLFDRKPEYSTMVDKVEAKKYVTNIIGEKYVIPTLAVYNTPEEIDFSVLPNQFVLKVTHDSGGVVICTNKKELEKECALDMLNKSMKVNYYWKNREWPYKNVKPRIIAEKYMCDASGGLTDYKFFCFNGKPEYMFIATDRFTEGEETKFDFYDMNFNHLPFINGHPNATKPIQKPLCFEEMKQIAAQLSKSIPHVRIDLYEVNGKVYFGEMTFFHWSGFVPFEPIEWDYIFGEKIKLPKKFQDN